MVTDDGLRGYPSGSRFPTQRCTRFEIEAEIKSSLCVVSALSRKRGQMADLYFMTLGIDILPPPPMN
jgi:hypothetical protein